MLITLTALHTIFVRHHNHLAEGLSHINPFWDDERLFQEARRILIAQMQHITYNEYLPVVLGQCLPLSFVSSEHLTNSIN